MANNPYVNRVDYGGNTLIDLTADTVAADKLLSGYTAHDRSGAAITGSIQSKAAQTYTPGTASQTVPGGVYLSGDQTVAGDANLVAGNIKSGVTIFGVTGTLSGGGPTIHTGTTVPAASLGSDGDLYLMTTSE